MLTLKVKIIKPTPWTNGMTGLEVGKELVVADFPGEYYVVQSGDFDRWNGQSIKKDSCQKLE